MHVTKFRHFLFLIFLVAGMGTKSNILTAILQIPSFLVCKGDTHAWMYHTYLSDSSIGYRLFPINLGNIL